MLNNPKRARGIDTNDVQIESLFLCILVFDSPSTIQLIRSGSVKKNTKLINCISHNKAIRNPTIKKSKDKGNMST